MHNLVSILKKIERLAAECRADVEASDRPLDAVPMRLVLPIFFVHPDNKIGWERSVAPEVWERIQRLKQEPELIVIPEEELQRTPFALPHAEMQQFRNGPLLRMMSLVDLRLVRNSGGRLKRHVELAIREALEFAVFRRDAEIGALIACMRARYDGANTSVTKGAGLNALAELAWIPGIPTKGKTARGTLSEADQCLAQFETLRSEGEKLAVKWLPGLADPSEAEATIVAQICDRANLSRSKVDFENAIKASARWVHTLMRACVHVTEVAEEKHELAKRAKKVEALRRPPKNNNPFHREPMTYQQHALFTRNEFSAVDLTFLAVAADIDPNLVTINHVLATPEFRVARKLGRIGRGHRISLDLEEMRDLKELILGKRGHAEGAMFREVHGYLAECALELLPMAEWSVRLDDAILHEQELTLPDSA